MSAEFWLRYGAALAIIAAMLVAGALVGRFMRRVPAGSRRRMELLETLPLSPQSALHIVRVDSRELLVGCGAMTDLSARASDES